MAQARIVTRGQVMGYEGVEFGVLAIAATLQSDCIEMNQPSN